MEHLSVSFIIPAYNEEVFLPSVLKNITKYTPAELTYEVIVADNGSEDKTVQLAREAGAKVLIDKEATIGGLRNLAVDLSTGEVLVFLDADILLTQMWADNIIDVYKSLVDDCYLVTGSRCVIPTRASWVEKIWFKPLVSKTQVAKYINSGHLIVSRKLFDMVGGFDVNLETGEDYAFGQAAIQAKAIITNNPLLSVVHKGYPKTIYQFMRREMWHGRGDCESWHSMVSSKVAMASILFASLHLLLVFGFVMSSVVAIVATLLVVLIMCAGASIYKHNARTIKDLVFLSFLYYLYFISRSLSCISFMSVRSVKRKEDG
ncbi:glycosyltransferase [Cardiobacterium sp. AH-315-I02]|nr:glycosyltransferase [Cardiobacterium sp. AH-315-I02]